jgi:hypothetical protein
MTDAIKYLLSFGAGVSITAAIVLVIFLNPDKAQIWASWFWAGLSKVYRGAQKKYTKYDLQGHINDFSREVGTEAPFLAATQVRVEFTKEAEREAFLRGDAVIIRLRTSDREDQNFIHGAYMFVSASLLFKAKRYLSDTQRTALDLFVTAKLLGKERPAALGHFLDEYVHPELAKANAKEGQLFEKFEAIESRGHFYSVVLQEFDFLGSKVFGRRKDDRVITEVRSFIDLMESFALRKIGEEGDLKHVGTYCRMALVIIGKSVKLSSGGVDPYVNYIRRQLVPKSIETVYVLGAGENAPMLDTVAARVADVFEVHRQRRSQTLLEFTDGRQIAAEQYLVVLRLKGVSAFHGTSAQTPADASGRDMAEGATTVS